MDKDEEIWLWKWIVTPQETHPIKVTAVVRGRGVVVCLYCEKADGCGLGYVLASEAKIVDEPFGTKRP
jgi:hypothetical protein